MKAIDSGISIGMPAGSRDTLASRHARPLPLRSMSIPGLLSHEVSFRMKCLAVWTSCIIGALAIVYAALHLYAMLTAPRITPGDPIEIYRDPDAPKYSALPLTTRSRPCRDSRHCRPA